MILTWCQWYLVKNPRWGSAFSMKHFEAPHRAIACHNRSMNPQRPCCKGRYAAYQIQASDEVVPVLGGKNLCTVEENVSEKSCLQKERRGTLESDNVTLFLLRSCTQHYYHADLSFWGMLINQLQVGIEVVIWLVGMFIPDEPVLNS